MQCGRSGGFGSARPRVGGVARGRAKQHGVSEHERSGAVIGTHAVVGLQLPGTTDGSREPLPLPPCNSAVSAITITERIPYASAPRSRGDAAWRCDRTAGLAEPS
jgi:hypothetical protein